MPGPEEEEEVVIQAAMASTSATISLDGSDLIDMELAAKVLPTSFATASHGVPAVSPTRNSLPLFTVSAIVGGMLGSTYERIR